MRSHIIPTTTTYNLYSILQGACPYLPLNEKIKKTLLIFKVLFLRRAHSPDSPPLDSNPLPADYETKALANAPPGTVLYSEHALAYPRIQYFTGSMPLLTPEYSILQGAYPYLLLNTVFYKLHSLTDL